MHDHRLRFAELFLLSVTTLAACAADPHYDTDNPITPVDPGPVDWPRGFHVVENQIQDGDGNAVTIYGVNRSGTEYKCVQGPGAFFAGPSNEASVAAMTTWPRVNAGRVPLNESCWLGINGALPDFSGDRYKLTI